mmetsp:Transcript_23451/g.34588  ORF Transcript_23451/g.34588 Transcript_23451/m.34588 type:complete len:100 (+) Transcript_23451:2903-3202(+)
MLTSHIVRACTEHVRRTSITRAISPKKEPLLSRMGGLRYRLFTGRSSRKTSTIPLAIMNSSLPTSPLKSIISFGRKILVRRERHISPSNRSSTSEKNDM